MGRSKQISILNSDVDVTGAIETSYYKKFSNKREEQQRYIKNIFKMSLINHSQNSFINLFLIVNNIFNI